MKKLMVRVVYPNGMTASWAYDANNQLLQVCNATLTNIISQYDYVYDAASRRINVSKSGAAFNHDDSIAYGYNIRSELTNAVAAVDSNYSYAYDFDDIGNRETSSERGTNSIYCANNLNQYTAVDDFTPQFDDDGNQTLIKTATGIWSVTYNGENRPIFWVQGTNTIAMSYDRMGRRVTKNNQRFVYNGYLQIADSNGNAYIWDPTEPIATRPLVWQHGDSVLYYAHDGNKNISEVVSDENEISAHYEYAPFGAVTLAMGEYAFSNTWRFSSEYADDSLVLIYYNYRHYEPVYGRWMGRDPYENSHEINNYLMCINKSFDAFDVLGLWSSFIIMTHQNMVKESIGQLRTRIKSLQSRVARYVIASKIIDGNVGMDRGTNANATKEALPLHYNVAEGQTPFDAINRFKKGLSNKREKVKIGLESEFLSDAKCKEILRILGEVTHMLQDYYGHGVSWLYVKGADDKLIGNTYGSPDTIKENLPEGALVKLVLKPSMYIGHFSSSEHGPLWRSEPGNRAPDRDNRHRDSVAMTVKELNEASCISVGRERLNFGE